MPARPTLRIRIPATLARGFTFHSAVASDILFAGEFVGGCDIATQMHQSGELGKLIDEKVKAAKK